MEPHRPVVTNKARRWKSYYLFNGLVKDLQLEGLQEQHIIRVCVHVYKRIAERKMFGNQYSIDRAWDAMNIALLDNLKCDIKLIEATMKEMTGNSG